MKKVLLASTALVLTAGVAAADVSVGGSANFGLKYDGGATGDNTTLHYEVDFGVSGSGTTDSGLAFGASIDLDAEVDGPTGTPSTNDVKDPEVFISGSFGTLTVGDLDFAVDGFGIADAGFDGIGLDDDAESLRAAGGAVANVTYEYVFGDVAVLVSYHTVEDDLGLTVSYTGSSFSAGLGYQEDDSTGFSTVTLVGDVSFGDVTVGGIFSDWSEDAQAYGIDVVYSAGPTTVTFVYGDTDVSGDDADYGIGAAYDLGGGAELAGAIGSVDGETKADLGLNLSF